MYEVAIAVDHDYEEFSADPHHRIIIMGQSNSSNNAVATATQHKRQSLPPQVAKASAKVYPRHSTMSASAAAAAAAAAARKDDLLYREHMLKIRESMKVKDSIESMSTRVDRPVTISEMNAYNVEKSEASPVLSRRPQPVELPAHSSQQKNNKEFYSVVGEGYHKTDSCYYKTPDGGYHKLPPDSFHKMSEICYAKQADGTFRRVINSTNNNNNGQPSVMVNGMAAEGSSADANSTGGGGGHHKVRNQMIRFLKRSKSHTPATIKEMQKAKDKERDRLNATAAMERHNNSSNRKVVVTMMENGGLPIVATSKPAAKREPLKTHHSHLKDQNRNSTKVCFILVVCCFFFFFVARCAHKSIR